MATALPYQSPTGDAPRPSDTRRRRTLLWTLAAVAAVLLVGISSCSYWFLGVGQRSSVVEYPDAVQVLARPGEAWLFLDIEKGIKQPGAIAGAPRTYVIQQLAIAFDDGGVKRRIPLAAATRFQTFNKNLSVVFGLDDGMYLLDRPSLLYRWNGDHFQEVAEFNRKAFTKVPALAVAPDYQEDEVLDAASVQHGWTPVLRDSFYLDDVSFDCNGGRFVLDTDPTTTPATVRLRRVDAGHEWSADIARFNSVPRPTRAGE